MHDHKDEFKIERMASVFKVTRSGYYAFMKRGESSRSKEDKVLLKKIEESYQNSNRRYGSPSIHGDLKGSDIKVGRKRVARIMRENGIKVDKSKIFKTQKTKKKILYFQIN